MICWRCKFNKECDGLKIRSCKDFLPRSNGDRIRGMTDEELAGWIYTHRWNDFDGLLDWLKKGVGE